VPLTQKDPAARRGAFSAQSNEAYA
jgi:hypothetical protein